MYDGVPDGRDKYLGEGPEIILAGLLDVKVDFDGRIVRRSSQVRNVCVWRWSRRITMLYFVEIYRSEAEMLGNWCVLGVEFRKDYASSPYLNLVA